MRLDMISLACEMARHDVTGRELAQKAGISAATLSAVRRGKTCRPETAAKIADALGVPLADLLITY